MTGLDWVTKRERARMRADIEPHRFENPEGRYSPSCTRMVERNGSGEDCGLPADDVLHNESVVRMVEEAKQHEHAEPTSQPARVGLLTEAAGIIIGERQATYGSAKASFQRIADLWNAYLGVDVQGHGGDLRNAITANQAAMMLALLKVSRAAGAPGHRDSYVDLAGYAALAGEIGMEEQE